jgi:hypothetical protein
MSHRLSFCICKVSFCSAVCVVTMAAKWNNLPPLCTCNPSFRTVHVIFYGINKYPNRENELSKSSSNLNVGIFLSITWRWVHTNGAGFTLIALGSH